MHSAKVHSLVLSLPVRFCQFNRQFMNGALADFLNSTNVLTVLSLVAAYVTHNHFTLFLRFLSVNGLLTWIGRGFGITALTLQLIIGYIFYPVTFFLGVPRPEILRVSQIFATKIIANEFAAYIELQGLMTTSNPLSSRAYTIATYGLCGFANLGSLGIQIGVLGALAPSRAKTIARIAISAMICGFLSTLQTAGIVYVLCPDCHARYLVLFLQGHASLNLEYSKQVLILCIISHFFFTTS